MIDYSIVTTALAASNTTPQAGFAALCQLSQSVVGAKLFTIMAYNAATGEATRIYTNMPEAYPVSGTKPLNPTHWSRILIEQHRTFVANDYEGVRGVFFDHELIRSLGCEAVMNIPIVIGGTVRGTLNCLDVAGAYPEHKVAASEQLKLPGAACLLFALQADKNALR